MHCRMLCLVSHLAQREYQAALLRHLKNLRWKKYPLEVHDKRLNPSFPKAEKPILIWLLVRSLRNPRSSRCGYQAKLVAGYAR